MDFQSLIGRVNHTFRLRLRVLIRALAAAAVDPATSWNVLKSSAPAASMVPRPGAGPPPIGRHALTC